jgi:hypothetical protein
MVARATVCETFQTGTTPTGTRIPILGGDVQLSAAADIRSTLSLDTDGELWSELADGLVVPYGNEIYVERGIAYSDAEIEWVGLGYHRIQTPEQDDAGTRGPISIDALDRMAGIIDGRLIEPIQFVAGATLGFIFETLIERVYPTATIEWDDATDVSAIARSVVVGLEEDSQPFPFLDLIVRSHGKQWYWDHRGVLVIKAMPDPSEPVWEVMAGRGGALLSLSRRLTREGVYNAVVASGEGGDTEAPARGVAADLNANSPTYFYGRFGPVPRYLTSSFIATDVQALNAARSELTKYLGLPYDVNLTAVPNPALEPNDPILTLANVREARRTHIIDTLTIPLTADGAMTAQTRQQTLTLPGGI